MGLCVALAGQESRGLGAEGAIRAPGRSPGAVALFSTQPIRIGLNVAGRGVGAGVGVGGGAGQAARALRSPERGPAPGRRAKDMAAMIAAVPPMNAEQECPPCAAHPELDR